MSSDYPWALRIPLRSLLFVPGNRPDWYPKAVASGPDAVVLDLEDAIPPATRPSAATAVAEILDRVVAGDAPQVVVRVPVPQSWAGVDLLRTVIRPGISALMMPKVGRASDLRLVDEVVGWCEQDTQIPVGAVRVIPLLESAAAVWDMTEICTASKRAVGAGAVLARDGDLARDLGIVGNACGEETLTVRSWALLQARAAGVFNPIAGLWSRVDDLDGLRAFAEQSRSLGYEGMLAIHPSHVPVINEIFSLQDDERRRLERLVRAVEDAAARGEGAVIFDGEMVDEAMVATARERLARERGAASGGAS